MRNYIRASAQLPHGLWRCCKGWVTLLGLTQTCVCIRGTGVSMWHNSGQDMRSPLKGFQGFPGGAVVKNSPATVHLGTNKYKVKFDLWSGKIPHAREHLNPCTPALDPMLDSLGATATEPMPCNCWTRYNLEASLHKKRSHCSEKPTHHSEEQLPLSATREKPMQQRRPTTVKNK